MLPDIYSFYDRMERNNILLSFKGDITSDLLTSVLQIMESKLENLQEEPRIKKKVYNVLVECLQNLYHHIDDVEATPERTRSAIFLIGKTENQYKIITGNYIKNENISELDTRLTEINKLSPEELKEYYKQVLANGEMSSKGGGGIRYVRHCEKNRPKIRLLFCSCRYKVFFF